MDYDYRGTIVDLRQGKGKKGELTHGRILRNSIVHADGSKLTRMERSNLPADGFFVHRSRCANGAFAEKSQVLFNTADDGQRPMAVDVVLASVAVAESDPVSALESPAIEPIIETAPVKKLPPVIKNPNIVNETKPVESEALYARTTDDPEARLKGIEAVLDSADSKAISSSETTWEALKPVVDGIVGLLKEAPIFLVGLVIDLGRWLWKTGKNFIANLRAHKSAA